MALRLRKSFKLAPGIRLNASKSGLSLSAGVKGASVNFGNRGTYLNAGIPGSGLSVRQKVGGNKRASKAKTSNAVSSVEICVGLTDDGTLYFQDQHGNPLDEKYIRAAKKQQGHRIQALIEAKCDEINAQVEALECIHAYTPNPNTKPVFVKEEFAEVKPNIPTPKKPGLIGLLFKKYKQKVEEANRAAQEAYNQSCHQWEMRKNKHEKNQERKRWIVEKGIYQEKSAIQLYLEHSLSDIQWPRETLVAIDCPQLDTLLIDVDLPEIEDMPNKIASVPKRGNKLSVKEMSNTKLQQLYQRHIHSIGFRIIGEAFSLPIIYKVIFSGYSQRLNSGTGKIEDQYLYSVCVTRHQWENINFNGLSDVDPVEAFSQFELRRKMTKTGKFQPISPYEFSCATVTK